MTGPLAPGGGRSHAPDQEPSVPAGAAQPEARELPRADGSPAKPQVAVRTRRDLVVAAALALFFVVGLVVVGHTARRPLWYDEQWRAWQFALHGRQFWHDLPQSNAPSALLYVAAVKTSAAVFGQLPWALRLPSLLALPVLAAAVYLVGRRYLPLPAAVLGAVLVTGSSGVLSAGLQLKPYLIEAVTTLVMLECWAAAGPAGSGHRRRRLACFTGAGLASCASVPGLLVLLPLAASEVLLTPGRPRPRVAAAVDTLPGLALAALHMGGFVLMQSGQRNSHFWEASLASGRGFTGGVHFLLSTTWSTAEGLWLGLTPSGAALPGLPWNIPLRPALVLAGAAVLLGWLASIAALRRHRDGLLLLIVTAGATAMTAAASTLRYWPYGLVRTNIFLVPLLSLAALAGLSRLSRLLSRPLPRPSAPRSPGPRLPGSRLPGPRLPGPRLPVRPAAARAVLTAAIAALLIANLGLLHEWRRVLPGKRYGEDFTAAADLVRSRYAPGDIVADGTTMAHKGWRWALRYSEQGPPRLPRVARADYLELASLDDATLTTQLRRRHPGSHGYIFVARGASLSTVQALYRRITTADWCVNSRQNYPSSGALLFLTPCRQHHR